MECHEGFERCSQGSNGQSEVSFNEIWWTASCEREVPSRKERNAVTISQENICQDRRHPAVFCLVCCAIWDTILRSADCNWNCVVGVRARQLATTGNADVTMQARFDLVLWQCFWRENGNTVALLIKQNPASIGLVFLKPWSFLFSLIRSFRWFTRLDCHQLWMIGAGHSGCPQQQHQCQLQYQRHSARRVGSVGVFGSKFGGALYWFGRPKMRY